MSTRNAEKLRRLFAAELRVPWRTVRVVVHTDNHRRRRKHCAWPRRWEVDVVACDGRAVNTGVLRGIRRRWLVARAVAYAEAGAKTLAELDAYDAAHPPLHGRVGRGW